MDKNCAFLCGFAALCVKGVLLMCAAKMLVVMLQDPVCQIGMIVCAIVLAAMIGLAWLHQRKQKQQRRPAH